MLVIEFLKRVYEGQTEELVIEEELEPLWSEIQHSFVSSQVYHLLRNRQLLDKIPVNLRDGLKSMANDVLYSNMLIRSEMNQLLCLLEKEGIPAIPLKGILFSERYFGHFAARGTTDIDILIPPTKVAEAKELLQSLGYSPDAEEDPGHFHQMYMKHFANILFPFLSIELHWNVLRSHISKTHIENFWDRSEPYASYRYIRELSADQTFYHICLHSFNHHLLGVKYILDIAHLLYTRSNEIDYNKLLIQAKQDGNVAKVTIVLTHVYDLFPSLHHIKPFIFSKRWPFWSLSLLNKGVLTDKGIRYYLFRMFATIVAYDTWQQKMADFRYSWFPPREHALSLVKADSKSPFHKVYAKLYWNRFQRIRKSRLTKAKL